MAERAFDPDSPGARLLREFAASAREWEQTTTVLAHESAYLVDGDYSLSPGQRAEVPLAWAKSLVERGLASYAS
jgi:hypothetical protein